MPGPMKLPKMSANFRILYRDERGMTHPTGETFKLERFQNPRQTTGATLIKLSREAFKRCGNGQRPKLIGWKLI